LPPPLGAGGVAGVSSFAMMDLGRERHSGL